ncbi:hypothetical protein GCM10027418_03300 [Mariniluteicoccus endophyticus]
MLLPICIAISTLSVILAVVLWLRDRRGGAVQAIGFALLPIGLLVSGLAPLVADGVKALLAWARSATVDTMVGTGLGLIALSVVLWFVGGWIGRRGAARRAVQGTQGKPAVGSKASAPTASARKTPAPKAAGGRKNQAADPEMDEIEAILRNRGIE